VGLTRRVSGIGSIADAWHLHDIAITNFVCLMAIKGGGGNHRLRNIDCKILRGGDAINEVLNAKNRIDEGTIPE